MSALSATSKQAVSPWLQVHSGLGISLMDHLFNRLSGLFHGKWRQSFKTVEDIDNWRDAWAAAFDAKKITTEDVMRGLEVLSDKGNLDRLDIGWIPTAPDFIAACQLKDVRHAMHELRPLGLPRKPTEEEFGHGKEQLAAMLKMVRSSPLMRRST